MKIRIHQPSFVMNRVGAFLIDMFIISLMYSLIAAVVTGNYKEAFSRFEISLGHSTYDLLLALAIMLVYFVLLPFMWKGSTVGNRITRTKLVDESGEAVKGITLLWRFFVLALPNVVLLGIPAVVNVYMMLLRKDNRGYHDLAAKTKMVASI